MMPKHMANHKSHPIPLDVSPSEPLLSSISPIELGIPLGSLPSPTAKQLVPLEFSPSTSQPTYEGSALKIPISTPPTSNLQIQASPILPPSI
jgi:hypothetical protein